jgi:hypothetical protein
MKYKTPNPSDLFSHAGAFGFDVVFSTPSSYPFVSTLCLLVQSSVALNLFFLNVV